MKKYNRLPQERIEGSIEVPAAYLIILKEKYPNKSNKALIVWAFSKYVEHEILGW